jgi:hypothetical protein
MKFICGWGGDERTKSRSARQTFRVSLAEERSEWFYCLLIRIYWACLSPLLLLRESPKINWYWVFARRSKVFFSLLSPPLSVIIFFRLRELLANIIKMIKVSFWSWGRRRATMATKPNKYRIEWLREFIKTDLCQQRAQAAWEINKSIESNSDGCANRIAQDRGGLRLDVGGERL